MDIIQFETGEKLPVAFPFQAIVELMGDDGILGYLEKYTSLGHQLEIMRIGLKYGAIQEGKVLDKKDAEILDLAQKNLKQLRSVFAIYDGELAIYLKVYFSSDDEEKPAKKMTKEEKAEAEKKVKP